MTTKNNNRINSYFANVSTRRRSLADWRIYAAVTGSAMAMATNASAGVIYFSQTVTAGPLANVGRSSSSYRSQLIGLKSGMGRNIGASFAVDVSQASGGFGNAVGRAFFGTAGRMSVLVSGGRVKQLASGANISTALGTWQEGGAIANQRAHSGVFNGAEGWAANAAGLAGIRFSTTNNAWDYGWVRLFYTLGTNTLANSITATDWAYESTGAPITAGETASSSTPEPSTTALAILAAGAAGVAALRRRRREVSL